MRTRMIAVAVMATGAILWVRLSSGQEVRSNPGPGSGIVRVTGSVDVGNTPLVDAAQRGDWKVAVANAPDVRVTNTPTVAAAPPDFLKSGRRYQVTWPSGQREEIAVAQIGSGGWARIEPGSADGRRRWVNLAGAQAVEELPETRR